MFCYVLNLSDGSKIRNRIKFAVDPLSSPEGFWKDLARVLFPACTVHTPLWNSIPRGSVPHEATLDAGKPFEPFATQRRPHLDACLEVWPAALEYDLRSRAIGDGPRGGARDQR